MENDVLICVGTLHAFYWNDLTTAVTN